MGKGLLHYPSKPRDIDCGDRLLDSEWAPDTISLSNVRSNIAARGSHSAQQVRPALKLEAP